MNERKYYDPPRLAASILGWLLKDHWDTRVGDYEEYYNELAAEQGERKARWWYWGQVMRLLPDRLYEKAYWGHAMLKNYWLLGFRNLRKNKVASLINVLGLSAAVGIAITIFLLIQEVVPNDHFHENGERIFLIGHSLEHEGDERLWGLSPVPLGPTLVADFPQVEQAVRITSQGAAVRSSGSSFEETISFADVGFFDMLTFPLQQGQTTALEDPSAVIISSEMATKYFRDQDPLGETLEITFANGSAAPLIVRGVAEPFPHRASLQFDFLVGYAKRLDAGLNSFEDWATFTDGTFIQLHDPQDAYYLSRQLDRYVRAQNEANESWPIQAFFLDNIQHPDLLTAWDINDRAMNALPLWEIIGFGLIGVLILLISCFNYITISLGSVARRLKEIGIRKTAGAEKRQLVVQFLSENLVLCFLGLLGGIAFAWAVVLPFIYRLTSLQLHIDFLSNHGFWLFLIGLLAFIGLISGSYPAFYISSFRPAAILRGKLKLAEKKGLTHTLATVQFVLTLMTICVSLFIASLDNTLTGGDWGYDAAQTLVIPDLTHEQYTRLQAQVVQLPNVSQVAGAEHHIGSTYDQTFIHVDGVEKPAVFFGVGPAYLTSMGVRLETGRLFAESFAADASHSVVINQTFAHEQGWTEPIGQQIRIDGQAFSVIGVVEDVLVHPIAGKTEPIIFGLSDPTQYSHLTIQTQHGTTKQVIASLREIWDQLFPEVSFRYFPQREVFEEFDLIIHLSLQLSRYLGLFALLISCMGLFGMASQRVAQRIKEVGIRKAMGASASHVVFLVNRGFLVMLGMATLIATPLCYFGLSTLLSLAPVAIPLDAAPFVLANILVFGVAALSLLLQTKRLVRVNPVEVLRYE